MQQTHKTQADEKRIAKKTFNSVASGLFREMGKIFPSDMKLIFLNDELKRFAKDKTMDHVPAMKFFQSMNTSTGMPSVEVGVNGDAVIGEMILNRDIRLFSNDCKAEIPQLDALDFRSKWAVLSPENQTFVWGYLERMAQLSAKVAALQAVDSGDVMSLMAAVTQAAARIDGVNNPMSDEDKIRAVMADPAVASFAKDLSDKMNILPPPPPSSKK